MMTCDSGSTQILTLNIPGQDNSYGTALDVSALTGSKSVVLSGLYVGQFVIYGSHNGVNYVPILTFNEGTGVQQVKLTFSYILRYLKVFRKAVLQTAVTIKIASQETCSTNNFISMPTILPRAEGAQPSVDLYALVPSTGIDPGATAIISGDFTGTIILEGSLDNINFSPIGTLPNGTFSGGFQSYPPADQSESPQLSPITITDIVRYIRLRVGKETFIRSTITVTIGASQNEVCSSGGGVVEGFNYAQMRLLTGNPGDVVNCYGRVSPDDGGEGVFVGVSGSAVDNDGTILVVNAGFYWSREQSDEILNVRWFGATGNGVTDDTAAINQTYALLQADVGYYEDTNQNVFFPRGKYLISGSIGPVAGAGFFDSFGEGPGRTLIKWGGVAGQPMFLMKNANKVGVRSLRIEGSASPPSYGVEFRRVAGYIGVAGISDMSVQDVYVAASFTHIDTCLGWTCESPAQDSANEQGQIANCFLTNYSGAGVAFRHLNSLVHQITKCNFSTSSTTTAYAVDCLGDAQSSQANVGGSFAAYDCSSVGHKAIFRVGAATYHPINVFSWHAESETQIWEIPYPVIIPSQKIRIRDFGSYFAGEMTLERFRSGCEVSLYGTTIGGSNVTLQVDTGAELAITDCEIGGLQSIVNNGVYIQRGLKVDAFPVLSGSGRRFIEELRLNVQETAQIVDADVIGGVLSLTKLYPRTQTSAMLIFAAPTTINSLSDHALIGQEVTLFAYNGNATIGNVNAGSGGNILLNSGVNLTLSGFGTSAITLVKLDAAFGSYWVVKNLVN